MVCFVCAGHICSGLSQSEFYLHVLMTTMHTGTGPASAAPSTQRISGQETLTAGCVGRAVGHGYGSHAFRCPHIEDSLQEQRNSQPDECESDRSLRFQSADVQICETQSSCTHLYLHPREGSCFPVVL